MVLPDSDGVSRVPPYSGSTLEGMGFRLQGRHLLWPTFPGRSPTLSLCNSVQSVLQPQEACFLVWAVPVSLAATQGIEFSFSSSGYLDVSVPRVCLTPRYVFTWVSRRSPGGGFPHSEISGSMCTYHSPEHFAVRRVLHRLLVPRHPPYALSTLI